MKRFLEFGFELFCMIFHIIVVKCMRESYKLISHFCNFQHDRCSEENITSTEAGRTPVLQSDTVNLHQQNVEASYSALWFIWLVEHSSLRHQTVIFLIETGFLLCLNEIHIYFFFLSHNMHAGSNTRDVIGRAREDVLSSQCPGCSVSSSLNIFSNVFCE